MKKLKVIQGSKKRPDDVKKVLMSWGAIDAKGMTFDNEDNYYYVAESKRVLWINKNISLLDYLNCEIIELPKKEEQKHQFKPYDRVLVRDSNEDKWACDIFSHYFVDVDGNTAYVCVGYSWFQCIPFEGNEELLETANEPKGGEEL